MTDAAIPLETRAVHDGRPPATFSRLEAVGEIALCSSLPTQLVVAWALRLAGWPALAPDGSLSLGFVVALSLLDSTLLIGLMIWLLRSRGERPSALWLGPRPAGYEALLGIVFVPVVFGIVAAVILAIRHVRPEMHNVDINPFQTLASHGWKDAVLLILVAIVAGGFREELQRAFLIDRFERALGPAWLGVVLLSVAFGLGHLVQGRDAAVATGAIGAFWAIVYLRRRSTVAPLVSHALFDSLQVLQIIALSRS